VVVDGAFTHPKNHSGRPFFKRNLLCHQGFSVTSGLTSYPPFRFANEFAIYTSPGGFTDLYVYRAPVTYIHGLWSNSSSWGWPFATDTRYLVHIVDYRETNAASLSENLLVPYAGVAAALQKLRDQGIAAWQSDVIAHSMGGLLVRKYAATSLYDSSEVYGAGNIRKLITVDTPHLGSRWANIMWALTQDAIKGAVLKRVFNLLGWCLDCGAIGDLRTESNEIETMPATVLPVHAIIGKGGSDMLAAGLEDSLVGPERIIWDILQFLEVVPEDVFPPELQHDWLVGRISQEGGLASGSLFTSVFEFESFAAPGIH
jgi:pimeloyl-ACP methyl ester carboxylesterase